ncbi:MAG: CoA pyrophosphatase [Pseudomonadota bacterium]
MNPTKTMIGDALLSFSPELFPVDAPRKSAGVCLILSEHVHEGELSLLMIRRAKYKGDPWSGHMAFPGGRVEAHDPSIKSAALRELSEELSVDESSLTYLGQLSDLQATMVAKHKRLVLSSFVFLASSPLTLTPNSEVAAYYWIPLQFFLGAKRRNMWWMRRFRVIALPFYRYQAQRIWGLSLAMIDQLFQLSGIPLTRKPLHRAYRGK